MIDQKTIETDRRRLMKLAGREPMPFGAVPLAWFGVVVVLILAFSFDLIGSKSTIAAPLALSTMIFLCLTMLIRYYAIEPMMRELHRLREEVDQLRQRDDVEDDHGVS